MNASAPDVEAAIARIKRSRQTHVEWRDYWLAIPGCENCESCRSTASVAGDLARQVRLIAEYDNVLAVLSGLDKECGSIDEVYVHP